MNMPSIREFMRTILRLTFKHKGTVYATVPLNSLPAKRSFDYSTGSRPSSTSSHVRCQ